MDNFVIKKDKRSVIMEHDNLMELNSDSKLNLQSMELNSDSKLNLQSIDANSDSKSNSQSIESISQPSPQSIESISDLKSSPQSIESNSQPSPQSIDSSPEQEDMEIDVIESTDLNTSTNLNKTIDSTSQLNKSSTKKPKRTKEQLEQEKQEREARKAKEEEEKRLRKEKREKEWELSRQKKEEKRKQIEQNRIEREEKRKQKEFEIEEKKRLLEQQKLLIEQKKAEKEKEKELRRVERDEKKRQEDERKRQEEEEKAKKEQKKQLESNRFQSFFKKVSPNEKKNSKIGNFELQKDQSIALLIPDQVKESFCVGAFDSIINHQDTKILYLDEIRNKTRKPIKNKSLNKLKQKKDDIVVENDQSDKKVYRAKLLQFHENNRPAYFGTWRKNCENINGRKILGQYDKFDYTIDSDEEWEEEEKGESIRDSDEEGKLSDEEEENDDYEIDEFFVPHGHLSDDENNDESELVEIEEMPDGQKKRKLLTKEKLIMEERTKKLKRLVPKQIGCLFWQQDEFENKAKFAQFEKYKVCFVN